MNQITKGVKKLKPSLTSETSIYLQISQMIENDILRDILREEERVPSTNELAKMYSINPATAAKGINLLVDKGILYKKRGVGMFVQEGSKEKIIAERKTSFYSDFVVSLVQEAKNLQIKEQELVNMIQKAEKEQL